MASTAQTLMEMYEAARERFGHQGWWPGEGALEICVGAILTQNTNWANVEKAIANLKTAGCMSAWKLHAKPQAAVAELIRPAGYFNVKAKRVKNFIARVHAGFGDDIEGFLDRPVSTLACGSRETASCDVPGSGEVHTGESPFAHFDEP